MLTRMQNEQPEDMAVRLFTEGKMSCSESVLAAMAAHWRVESPLIPRIATPFRGGLCGTQGLCGVVSGGLMAIGLRLGREDGNQSAQLCVDTGKAFMQAIQKEGALDCKTYTGLDFSVAEQHDLFQKQVRAEVCTALLVQCCRWLKENVQ